MSAGHWAAKELYRVMRTEADLSVDCAARAAAAHQVQGKTKTQAKLADAFLVVRVLFPLASDTLRGRYEPSGHSLSFHGQKSLGLLKVPKVDPGLISNPNFLICPNCSLPSLDLSV